MPFPVAQDRLLVTHIGLLAMISCEPRQARKGATVAMISCAGVRLVWVTATIATGDQLASNQLTATGKS